MQDPLTTDVSNVRVSYDRVAEEYARHLFKELDGKALDRELLTRLASRLAGKGEICDLGCGPGQIARYLRDQRASVFGLDLSAQMVRLARELSPEIQFREGNMFALDLQENSLAGVAAFYAIVNFPSEALPRAFREIARVLQPEGVLLLSFHVGDEILHVEELWGLPISLDFFLFQPENIQEQLEDAGLVIEEVIEREPYAPDVEHQTRRAYIFARKP